LLSFTASLPIRQFGFSKRSAVNQQPDPLTFRQFIERVAPKFKFYPHIEKLIEVLQQVADGGITRLMVFMPPRHGKSETVSRLFSAYYLYRYPHRWVAITSYAAELAFTLSRNSRENYTEAGGAISADAFAVKHWESGKGGGLWATGVGGLATGKGFHLGVCDDPLKNSEEAGSETIREKQKDWWRSTFSTREEPGGAVIVIMTRWHEDDLAGWLLSREVGSDEPERWHVVNMPAVAEDRPLSFPATCTVEPDERQPGEALCPERYNADKLRRIMHRMGSYFWAALFQQRPAPRDGEMFRRQWFSIVQALPAGCRFVRYWDKAGTAGDGAYSAGVLMAVSPDGRFFVVDVQRGQWSFGQREIVILQTAHIDQQRYREVSIWVEQEPGSGGKESAERTVQNLAGFTARAEPVTGDKELRAGPLAAQAEVGNVSLLLGDWNGKYLDELAAFPNGTYKDQVDASSGAFNKLALKQVVTGSSAVVSRKQMQDILG
jgi:predicted phage terminase large subunit-like protein